MVKTAFSKRRITHYITIFVNYNNGFGVKKKLKNIVFI